MQDEKDIEVIFFDIRDTLGEVDRPGHLVPYRPSTEKLLTAMKEVVGLRIGVISNLPSDVSADQGRAMLTEAGIAQYLDPNGIILNKDVGVDKPDPQIFQHAAAKMGVSPSQCIFSGENLNEVFGALKAGMLAVLKPCPPGREFTPPPIERRPVTATDSGRAFEAFFEHEHLLGERIFACGAKIVEEVRKAELPEQIPENVMTAVSLYVYLTNNFADQAHFTAEEAAIPLAIARGMDPERAEWVLLHHEQARAFFKGFDVAYRRMKIRDRESHLDFAKLLDAFVHMFFIHAEREDEELYPEMGKFLTESDDSLLMNILSQIGPRDFTPWVGIVSTMEAQLGIPSP